MLHVYIYIYIEYIYIYRERERESIYIYRERETERERERVAMLHSCNAKHAGQKDPLSQTHLWEIGTSGCHTFFKMEP